MEYWNEKSLFCITSLLGHSIRTDPRSLHFERDRFAHIFIEIDITKPLIYGIWIGETHMGIFALLPSICYRYGCLGYRTDICLTALVLSMILTSLSFKDRVPTPLEQVSQLHLTSEK